MFRYDVLIQAGTGDYVVIDFGYFNSFAGAKNLGSLINKNVIRAIGSS
jgi:hypothetical protein